MLDPNSRPNPRISVFMQGDNRESPQVAATSRSDPLDGWSDGVTLQRSHFCLMLKPQIVLQCDANDASVCVLAAVQATSRAYAIMDDLNADDPVNGKIMTRFVDTMRSPDVLLIRCCVLGAIQRFLACKCSLPLRLR
jgi:hypothetical protein